MANEVTSAISSALYSNIVQAGLYTLQEASIMRPLVRNYDMTGTPGLTAQVPIFPALTADEPGDGGDLSNKAFNVQTSKTITATEKGILVTLTDLATETASEDVAAAIGRQIGQGMALKVDQDIAALFTGFSNTVGSGGTDVSVDTMFQAAAKLRNNKAPGPYYCVLHPYQAYSLKKQLTNAGATMSHNLSDVGNTALAQGFVGMIAGINIFESTVIGGNSASSTGTGNYYGAVFSQDAIGFMLKRNMRVENQRDASLRATEIVGSMAYGVSEIFDQYGVAVIGNATL
jgi:N4-gp56 family major capsid protein